MDFLPIYNIHIPKFPIDNFIIETSTEQLYLDKFISSEIQENANKYHELRTKYKGLMEYIIDIYHISSYLVFLSSITIKDKKVVESYLKYHDDIIKNLSFKLQSFDKPFIGTFDLSLYFYDDIFKLPNINALFIFVQFQVSDVINFRHYRENNVSINIVKNDHYDCLEFTDYLIGDNTVLNQDYITHNNNPPIFYKKVKGTICNYKHSSNIKYKYISESINVYTYKTRFHSEYYNLMHKLGTILLLYDLLEEGGAFIFRTTFISLELTANILCLLTNLFQYVYIYKSSSDPLLGHMKKILCFNFKPLIPKGIIEKLINDLLKINNECSVIMTQTQPSGSLLNKEVENNEFILPKTFITKIIPSVSNNVKDAIILSNDMEEKNLINNIKKAYEIIKLYEIMDDDEKKIYLNNLLTLQYIKVKAFYEYYQLPIPTNILFDKEQVNIIENLLIKFPKNNNKLISLDTYKDKFKYLENKLYVQKRKIDVLDPNKYKKITDNIKISSNLKHIVSNLIDYKVSQAFLKMIEIIYETNLIIKDIKSFHTCELPGQMIMAINYYCKKNNLKVDWIGQSLNPKNEENIKKYGTDIFGDDYGLLKNNKDKWDFNSTGDVLTNVKYYSDKYYNKMDLMTSDCGLPDSVFGVQEDKMLDINLSQFTIALNVLKKGGNYVYKIFLPCINPTNIFMIYTLYSNFEELYLYKPYQNPSSSEIYVIAKNYNKLDKIESIKYEDIEKCKYDSSFLNEYYNSINRMIEKTIGSMNRTIYLYYNEDEIEKIDRNKFNKFWIDKYKIK